MARRDKPRLEWEGADAFLASPSRYSRIGGRTLFARIRHDRSATASFYFVLTNDFVTTNRTFNTYEDARSYILALYALID